MIQQPQTTEPPDQEASIKSAPICPSHQLPMDDPFGYGAGRKVFDVPALSCDAIF
jgi:hypothetical protein